MEINRENVIHSACRRSLRPIVSLLLRYGMTWKEFSDLSKSVFVLAATEEFGIRGRPANVSRASISTGISHKVVNRQRDLLESGPAPDKGKPTDATRVLSSWFLDGGSEPRFGGFAANDDIPLNRIPRFREFMDKRGQEILEGVDDW